MINPKINLGARALGGLASAIFVIICIFIGMKFGIRGLDVFLLILLGVVALFIIYWIVKIFLIKN